MLNQRIWPFSFSWDNFYNKELSNFQDNHEDTGENWFSDSNAQDMMVRYLEDLSAEQPDLVNEENTSFIDLGTGNGQLLVGIREAGFEGHLTGIDYSGPSIDFAKKVVVENEGWNPEDGSYDFQHADFLSSEEWNKDNRQWDVVLDKGTLDAIALSDLKYDYQGKQIGGVEMYSIRAASLVKPNGIMLITSCNFTEEELIKIIESDSRIKYFDKVNYPTFQFGGVKGQTVCTIAFRREQ